MVDTAAAVQAAPPSILKELMAGIGITEEVLGKTPMPSTHANPPSAKLLIAQALAERAKLEGPKITPAQAALATAEEQVQLVDDEANAAARAIRRHRARLLKAKKAFAESPDGSAAESAASEEMTSEAEKVEAAKAAYAAAKQRQDEVREDLAAAKFGLRDDMDDAARDEYYATLTAEEVDAISRSLNRRHAAEASAAIDGTSPLVLGNPRDTSVYVTATIPMETGSGVTEVDGRLLDGGTAIVRRGYSDFLILQKKGDAYFPVAAASSKSQALDKANRIPVMSELALSPDATDMQRQALATKADLALDLAGKAAEGAATSTAAQQKILDDGLTAARTKLADDVGAGPVRADIYEGVKRHKKAMREKAAVEAGQKARAEALANGAGPKEAQAAYDWAHRRALGTPTRGGGTIPHFDHKIPPDSLGAEKHAACWRSGVRPFGNETATDYEVIAKRSGDLKQWGFSDHSGQVKMSNIGELTKSNTSFVEKVLSAKERSSLRTYTGGSYTTINAAITGRDPSPSPSIKTTVSGITSAFDKFSQNNPNMQPMNVIRGTRVPSAWKGSADEYIAEAFPVGSKVQIGKVTSASTNQHTAVNFAAHAPKPYMMVIRTREGIPVKSISHYSSEDEVVIPVGADLRCVKVDQHGIGGMPTVYLVAEDLVAEADGGTAPFSAAA